MRPFRILLAPVSAAVLVAGLAALSSAEHHELPRTPSVEGARVYLISPAAGATVSSPVLVRFGLSGMGVVPAGIDYPGAGHHHLIVDAPLPDMDAPLPANDNHRHFGAGQTEVALELAPGSHTLRLVLADRNHVPHQPPVVSEAITITVR